MHIMTLPSNTVDPLDGAKDGLISLIGLDLVNYRGIHEI